jgi:hypothetical protein
VKFSPQSSASEFKQFRFNVVRVTPHIKKTELSGAFAAIAANATREAKVFPDRTDPDNKTTRGDLFMQ